MNEIDMMDNYDMIIHLVTAADGAEEAYTLSNNAARTETVEEAKILDRKTINAWTGHQNLKIISNNTTFDKKMNQVIETINSFINAPIEIREQRKYLIDLKNSDLSFLNEDNSTSIVLEQYYLDTEDVETRLRVRNYDGSQSYYITIQKKLSDGKSNVITNKNISKKVFEDFLLSSNGYKKIVKQRVSFVINKQYYRLDIYDDEALALLEVEPTKDNQVVNIPSNFKVLKEVTNEYKYDNSEIAKKEEKILIKR